MSIMLLLLLALGILKLDLRGDHHLLHSRDLHVNAWLQARETNKNIRCHLSLVYQDSCYKTGQHTSWPWSQEQQQPVRGGLSWISLGPGSQRPRQTARFRRLILVKFDQKGILLITNAFRETNFTRGSRKNVFNEVERSIYYSFNNTAKIY